MFVWSFKNLLWLYVAALAVGGGWTFGCWLVLRILGRATPR